MYIYIYSILLVENYVGLGQSILGRPISVLEVPGQQVPQQCCWGVLPARQSTPPGQLGVGFGEAKIVKSKLCDNQFVHFSKGR